MSAISMRKAVYWALYRVWFQNRSELCSCAIQQTVNAKKKKKKKKKKNKLCAQSSGIT